MRRTFSIIKDDKVTVINETDASMEPNRETRNRHKQPNIPQQEMVCQMQFLKIIKLHTGKGAVK